MFKVTNKNLNLTVIFSLLYVITCIIALWSVDCNLSIPIDLIPNFFFYHMSLLTMLDYIPDVVFWALMILALILWLFALKFGFKAIKNSLASSLSRIIIITITTLNISFGLMVLFCLFVF